ncbi:VRR-NUC domain-containing protein [Eubacterium sp. OM08-24]|jgi:hypothetical protein|uniref:VRR-NUC domain-containing protein n=1 Tax=Eubacterium sp. OM08-24 TaxID=2292352 RepID=UPI000E43D613|nr:VRR-NUC domain-containing protein [Eubacterium sp. OM08-24]RGM22317.1 VRR-NUC domain-containing protein [Eubacterium sp. OM08-24]
MRESEIERILVKKVKTDGGICLKWVCPSFNGMPDRLIFLPNGHFGMVELKSNGKKPRALQLARHKMLKRLGFKVYVIDDVEQIGGMIDEIQAT